MKRRSAARLAWSLAAVAVALSVVGIALAVAGRRDVGFNLAVLLVGVAPFMSVGALVASRFPRNPIGWIFCAVGLLQALQVASYEYAVEAVIERDGALPLGGLAAWISALAWMPSLGLLTTYLFLLFPDGHPPSPRWRWVGWTGGIGLGAVVVAAMVGNATGTPRALLSEEPLEYPPLVGALLLLGFVTVLVASVASVASLVVRYRRSRGDEREQLKWVAFAATFALVAIAVQFVPVGWPDWFQLLVGLGFLAVPVASGVAILKHRLYDIDVVINKTVVYGALAAFVTVVYVGIVAGIGSLVGSGGNAFLTIVATAIIALLFQPARVRARHFANRLVYGKRATPYEVLSRLAQGMGSQYSADDALPSLARVLGEGTGAARAEVWLRVGSDLRPAASWPDDVEPRQRSIALADGDLPPIVGADLTLPVKHEGEVLGALAISMPRGETVTPDTERLLADVASQAGLLLRNVRLIEELRASRQRLVAAQDEERRRLERNIHDGAQQQLVALSVKVRLAESLARKDPDKATELMAEVRAETQQALDDLRDLARGVYPPLLADKGLAAALEAQARKVPFPVRVEPNGIGRYPPEAEANAYFCVLEALQNAAKYAAASAAVVRLFEDAGHLQFVVSDDGTGFDPDVVPRGSGLQNMADRLEALGGRLEIASSSGRGTTVTGRIPVQPVAAAQASSSRSGSNSDLGM
ncbi:MAG TPA: histidine kinase [Actinomycetota bacterium]